MPQSLVRPAFGGPVPRFAPAMTFGRTVPGSPRHLSHTTPSNVSKVLPWCSGSPVGHPSRWACMVFALRALCVHLRLNRMYRGIVCPMVRHTLSSSFLPSARTTTLVLRSTHFADENMPLSPEFSWSLYSNLPCAGASPTALCFGLTCRSPDARVLCLLDVRLLVSCLLHQLVLPRLLRFFHLRSQLPDFPFTTTLNLPPL